MSSVNYRETEEYKKYKGKCSMILTSPPYFAKEEYSDDLEQSYLHFSNYKDWLGNFLFNRFKIGFEMVKGGIVWWILVIFLLRINTLNWN